MIAPYESTKPQIFEKAWEYDLANGTIAVGWARLGDVSRLKKSEIESRYRQFHGSSVAPSLVTRDVNALWAFYHEISPGDVVIARRGTKRVVGIGTVTGPPFFDERAGRERVGHLTEDAYPNLLPVRWEKREIEFDRIVFSFYTIYEIPEERYLELTRQAERQPASEAPAEFELEKHLEDFIVKNFARIFKDRLKLIEDEGGIGRQYPVISDGKQIGCIDILAKEPQTNCYVIIELKRGRESDKVVGQILRYMGWVSENLCQPGESVKGLIICKEADEKLKYALKLVGDKIKVSRYVVDFRLVD